MNDMTPAELKSLPDPSSLSAPLQALWQDAQGDWERAHELAQSAASAEGNWIHAYLHRKEGDLGNAGYWYARARRVMPTGSLEDEWTEIAAELLRRGSA